MSIDFRVLGRVATIVLLMMFCVPVPAQSQSQQTVTVNGVSVVFNALSPSALFFVTPSAPVGAATLQLTTHGGCTVTQAITFQ